MNIKLQKYQKTFPYSYSYGPYATYELIKYQPNEVQQVIFHSKSEKNEGVQQIKKFCKENAIPTEINDGIIKKLTGKENIFVLGMFSKYQNSIDPHVPHLMLVSPGDTGNLGTIIRTMLGYEIRNLAIIRPGVDIFDPKVVRASMGAVFPMQFEYFDSLKQYTTKYNHHLYAFMTDGEREVSQIKYQEPYTLIFGNESSGLPESYKKISQTVRISQSPQIDSLNLAVSVGIGLYEMYSKKSDRK